MPKIEEEDARAMVRLLGETAACSGGHQEKKRFLMEGVAVLVAADAWLWTLTCRYEPGGAQVHVGYLRDGFDDAQFSNFLQAIEHPALAEASKGFFETMLSTLHHTTMTRDEMDPEGEVYQSDVQALLEKAGLGDIVLSGFPLDDHSMSSLAFYRRPGIAPFTQREKQIIHIVLGEVPWLHMSGWPEDRGATVPQLYPRQRIALNLLLEGLGRKQIASHMEITENTVAGYTKDLYKHFGVRSQPELMKKFLGGQSVA